MNKISISNNGAVVFSLNSGKEFAIDTNSVHYIAVLESTEDVDTLGSMQFEISKNNADVLSIIQKSGLFHVKEHYANNMLCTLKQHTPFVVAESLKNYHDFPADFCNDLICIQEPTTENTHLPFVFINFNYMDTMKINNFIKNIGIDTEALFGFEKINGKLELKRGKLNNLNECYAVIAFGSKTFMVKVKSFIEVLNKQQYGSLNSYRAKKMKERLSPIVNKLVQLNQIHQLFDALD